MLSMACEHAKQAALLSYLVLHVHGLSVTGRQRPRLQLAGVAADIARGKQDQRPQLPLPRSRHPAAAGPRPASAPSRSGGMRRGVSFRGTGSSEGGAGSGGGAVGRATTLAVRPRRRRAAVAAAALPTRASGGNTPRRRRRPAAATRTLHPASIAHPPPRPRIPAPLDRLLMHYEGAEHLLWLYVDSEGVLPLWHFGVQVNVHAHHAGLDGGAAACRRLASVVHKLLEEGQERWGGDRVR